VKKIAISQSNYIPWKGYFDLINSVDEFVLYDDVQFTKRDWRNRNQIKTATGLQWLTIPVEIKGKYHQRVCETRISDPDWPRRHWRSIAGNYARSAHFADYREQFENLYGESREALLSDVNCRFLSAIMTMLGIKTHLSFSRQFELLGDRSQRLLNICKQAQAEVYVSGPAAKNYLDIQLFEKEGIKVAWMDYTGYPSYRQLHGAFQHNVSIVDLLFNEGRDSPNFLKRSGR
jgi:WbqC-like protein